MYLCVYVCMCTLSDMKDKFLFVMCTIHSSPLFTHIIHHFWPFSFVHTGDCTCGWPLLFSDRGGETGDGTHVPIIPMLVDK